MEIWILTIPARIHNDGIKEVKLLFFTLSYFPLRGGYNGTIRYSHHTVESFDSEF